LFFEEGVNVVAAAKTTDPVESGSVRFSSNHDGRRCRVRWLILGGLEVWLDASLSNAELKILIAKQYHGGYF
jgi:hypothetical protein